MSVPFTDTPALEPGGRINKLMLMVGGLAAVLSSAPSLEVDSGTRVIAQRDVRALVQGTTLHSFEFDGPIVPFIKPTRMAKIRALAPLSLRDWAPVVGKSHTTVSAWAAGEEPNEPKLDQILTALDEASRYHADLRTWLTSPLPGMSTRPVDLLRESRWRAFRGAVRSGQASTPQITPNELIERRRGKLSWGPTSDLPITTDDE